MFTFSRGYRLIVGTRLELVDFRLQDQCRRSAAVYSAARLSVCRVVLQILRARNAQLVADILARMLA